MLPAINLNGVLRVNICVCSNGRCLDQTVGMRNLISVFDFYINI